jgi:hypothetical protein
MCCYVCVQVLAELLGQPLSSGPWERDTLNTLEIAQLADLRQELQGAVERGRKVLAKKVERENRAIQVSRDYHERYVNLLAAVSVGGLDHAPLLWRGRKRDADDGGSFSCDQPQHKEQDLVEEVRGKQAELEADVRDKEEQEKRLLQRLERLRAELSKARDDLQAAKATQPDTHLLAQRTQRWKGE